MIASPAACPDSGGVRAAGCHFASTLARVIASSSGKLAFR